MNLRTVSTMNFSKVLQGHSRKSISIDIYSKKETFDFFLKMFSENRIGYHLDILLIISPFHLLS